MIVIGSLASPETGPAPTSIGIAEGDAVGALEGLVSTDSATAPRFITTSFDPPLASPIVIRDLGHRFRVGRKAFEEIAAHAHCKTLRRKTLR